ncbi:MAG TPA: flavodoxin domain-containing protein [Rhodanobacteraceae bacterium]
MGMFRSAWFKDLFGTPLRHDVGALPAMPTSLLTRDPLLLAFATQTGAAETIAKATRDVLTTRGVDVRLIEFYDLDRHILENASQALFVVSTTCDGDPPDMAEDFRKQVMAAPAALPGLMYGLLALGDHDYDDFCGFGRAFDTWLDASGAHAWFDRIEVDDEDPDTIAHWHRAVQLLAGVTLPA